jgi:adenosylhomocysteinase
MRFKIYTLVHLEAKTAYLGLALAAVAVTGLNPFSTKDEMCAALDSMGVKVYTSFGATLEKYK